MDTNSLCFLFSFSYLALVCIVTKILVYLVHTKNVKLLLRYILVLTNTQNVKLRLKYILVLVLVH